MKVIDLRSDTVTLPSSEMRQSIFDAQLGDDVFQEDQNVNLLETPKLFFSYDFCGFYKIT